VRQVVAHELRLEPQHLEAETSFADYGVDSILLAQLGRALSEQVGEDLEPSLLFELDTVARLTHWMEQHYGTQLQRIWQEQRGHQIENPVHVPVLERGSIVATNEAPEQRSPRIETVSIHRPEGANIRLAEIAIVGQSCRFPGAADLQAYWELLEQGRSGIGPVPHERWGKATTYQAGLLSNITHFDPGAFLIAPEDAAVMDPQALLILEESLRLWHQAGYRVEEIKGARIGVYLGARSQHRPERELLRRARYPILGMGANYLAANVSQAFDLRGPGVVVDTACSSALVAMQMAIAALRQGEITGALVGGVSRLQSDDAHVLFAQRGILSPDGAFHVFDGRANGVVLGEGIGLVFLKTVEQAIADGDQIYAVIKGIASNNDGRTAGPSTPSITAQKEVMQEALLKSGLRADEISYIEANGSGSEVTDLLELKAIEAIYGAARKKACRLGSVKPNIGHPLSAEGIASVIKVAQMLHRKKMVPCLSGREPMKHYRWEESSLRMNEEGRPWEEELRVAGLNCFADGGTNVHIIMQGWDEPEGRVPRRHPLLPPVLTRHEVRTGKEDGAASKPERKSDDIASPNSRPSEQQQLAATGVVSSWKRKISEVKHV